MPGTTGNFSASLYLCTPLGSQSSSQTVRRTRDNIGMSILYSSQTLGSLQWPGITTACFPKHEILHLGHPGLFCALPYLHRAELSGALLGEAHLFVLARICAAGHQPGRTGIRRAPPGKQSGAEAPPAAVRVPCTAPRIRRSGCSRCRGGRAGSGRWSRWGAGTAVPERPEGWKER